MPITKAIVTHDMKPEVYSMWRKLAELHGMSMEDYLQDILEDQTYEASVARHFNNQQ